MSTGRVLRRPTARHRPATPAIASRSDLPHSRWMVIVCAKGLTLTTLTLAQVVTEWGPELGVELLRMPTSTGLC